MFLCFLRTNSAYQKLTGVIALRFTVTITENYVWLREKNFVLEAF